MPKETIVQQPGSTMAQTQFQNVPGADVERSVFDRSHPWKGPLRRAGVCYPCLLDEALPGDTLRCNATAFVRLATPLKPLMDMLHVDMHFFSVSNVLVWPQFYNLMGERASLNDSPENYSVPQTTVTLTNWSAVEPWSGSDNKAADYFGLPMGQNATISVSVIPFRALALIWNEWFRDQNLQEPIDIETVTGDMGCFPRGKRRDYFVSCLPFAQKGDPVTIPINDSALVGFRNIDTGGQPVPGSGQPQTYTSPDGRNYRQDGPGVNELQDDSSTNLGQNQAYVDLSQATATNINDLRTAFQIQKLLERDARSGTRMPEVVLAHFGVQMDDRRAFRPEYLGGGSSIMNISPVAATVATATEPQGELAAVGTGLTKAGFNHSFSEHSTVIGLISVRSELTYFQGVEKMWDRKTRYDFYWPVFQHLGEQAVKQREIYVAGDSTDDKVFGYQERWAEYRYKPGRVVNRFRPTHPSNLAVWHLAQEFSTPPALNEAFRVDKPPLERVVAVNTEPHFIADIWFDYKCERPMPVVSVPGLIDHF